MTSAAIPIYQGQEFYVPSFEVKLDNLQRLLGFKGDGGAGLHALSPVAASLATSSAIGQAGKKGWVPWAGLMDVMR